jgi:ABC-type glycerol-3-phosphate transport system substrate-binding protein
VEASEPLADVGHLREKLYGVPWFTDVGMLYYRRDLLQRIAEEGG